MLRLVSFLLLLTTPAFAGTTLAVRDYDDGTNLTFVVNARKDFDGVHIVAVARTVSPNVIATTTIQAAKTGTTTKTTLATCTGSFCAYNWPRDSMFTGSNDISLLVTLTNRSSYITTGTFGQPPKITPVP